MKGHQTYQNISIAQGADPVAFKIGSYVHHGTSDSFGSSPLCLLPPDMLQQHSESAAAKMLTVTCELDVCRPLTLNTPPLYNTPHFLLVFSYLTHPLTPPFFAPPFFQDLECNLDDDSVLACAYRAAFHDGVHGLSLALHELTGWADDVDEARLRACHRRGLWYYHESCSDGKFADEEPTLGAPRFILSVWEEYTNACEEARKCISTVEEKLERIKELSSEFIELEDDERTARMQIEFHWREACDDMFD